MPPAAAPPNCPQPLLADLPQLVDGSDIEAELRAELSKDLPPTAQRAVQGSADQHTQARAGSSAAIRIGQKDETLHVVVTDSSPNDLRFPSSDPTTAWSACTSARTARRQRQRGPPGRRRLRTPGTGLVPRQWVGPASSWPETEPRPGSWARITRRSGPLVVTYVTAVPIRVPAVGQP
ncbi:hypothetical protein [Streptomyces hokutonensis]|uniref:hypothetical protein n=1 Tax=Streptomyces hokutonensis TaxID=1306990 RepID=UPI00381D6BB6